MFVERVRQWFESQRGSILPFFALCVTIVFGVCAISLDAGVLYVHRIKVSNIADASALAGCAHLPTDPDRARDAATSLAIANGINANHVSVSVTGDGDSIEVNISQPARIYFGRVLGFGDQTIAAASAASVGTPDRVKGMCPFGVEDQELDFGELCTLKLGSGGGSENGNFHALALGGTGAWAYRDNIKYGYDEYIQIGDRISTEPGNMKGPTEQGVDYRLAGDPSGTFESYLPGSSRLILVPIVDSFEVHGREEVTVMGFASFFLEGTTHDGDVIGRFIRRVVPGDIATGGGAPDYGTRSIRLVKRRP